MISSDHRSPNVSNAILTGHPDRCFGLPESATGCTLTESACGLQGKYSPYLRLQKQRILHHELVIRNRRYTKFVPEPEIQIVSNEAGEPTAVIVPIGLWREIASERETAHLLKSETMRQRLQAAMQRQGGDSIEEVIMKLGL